MSPLPIWLRLEVAGLTASTTVKSDQSPDRRAFVFVAHPDEDHEIRLATGEILCHPRRYSPKKNKDAPLAQATLQFLETMGRADEPAWTIGAYPPTGDKSEPDYMDAFVQADVLLPRLAFSELLANIRAGIYPVAIRLDTEETATLKFEEHNPDLSVIEWDNRETSRARLTSIEFVYEFHRTRYDPEANPSKNLQDTADINFEDKREVARATLERLEVIQKRIAVSMAISVVLLVLILIAALR